MATRRFLFSSIIALLYFGFACGGPGKLLVPANGRSQLDAKPLRVVLLEQPRAEVEAAFLAPLAPVVAELAAKAIVQGIETESKRYEATYSARTFGNLRDGSLLFVIRCEKGVEVPSSEPPRCAHGVSALLFYQARIGLKGGGLWFEVVDYYVTGAKAKLAWPSFRPPHPFRLG